MSSTDNATSIIKGWEEGFSRTKGSYFERCLDAVGIPTDWKANDNEIEATKPTEYETDGNELNNLDNDIF